jgi:hypothetical protein
MDPPFRCFGCDVALHERTRFCPHCGVRLDTGMTEPFWPADVETKVYVTERPRLFGVPPQDTTLAVGFVAALLGIVLVAKGVALTGALLLAAGVVLLVVFAETFRRRPASAIVRWVVLGYDVLRAEVGFAASASATWLRARFEGLRLRREVRSLREARRGHLLALGECVYRDDMEGAEAARDALREHDGRIAERQSEIERLERRTAVRLRAARFWRRRLTAKARARAEPGRPVGA